MLDDSAPTDRAKETITAPEIADLLHMKPATFLRRRHKLTAAGMPRPVPGLELLWSRALIMAWINRDDRPDFSGDLGRMELVRFKTDDAVLLDTADDEPSSYLGGVRRALEARAGARS